MAAEVGSLAVLLALAASLYAALALAQGARRSETRWLASGRNALYATTALLGLALVLLAASFLANNFQVAYVSSHSSRELPLYLKLTAVWAGQEGSLLVWSFLQALFATLVVRPLPDRNGPLVPWAGVFLGVIVAFFVAVTGFLSNPFALLATVPVNGQGMSSSCATSAHLPSAGALRGVCRIGHSLRHGDGRPHHRQGGRVADSRPTVDAGRLALPGAGDLPRGPLGV